MGQDDVGWKEGVDIVKRAVFHNPFIITVKKVLHRVDAAVGTGGPGKLDRGTIEDAKGLFHLVLDGGGVVLDLESAVVVAFVGEFEEIPGHGAKIRGPALGIAVESPETVSGEDLEHRARPGAAGKLVFAAAGNARLPAFTGCR